MKIIVIVAEAAAAAPTTDAEIIHFNDAIDYDDSIDDNQLLTALQQYENENLPANDGDNAHPNNKEDYYPISDDEIIAATRMFSANGYI